MPRDGQEQPVSALTGFWILIPLAGWFIWLVKVQSRMNEFWDAHTPTPPAPRAPPDRASVGPGPSGRQASGGVSMAVTWARSK